MSTTDRDILGKRIPEPLYYRRRVLDSLESLNYLSTEGNKATLSGFDTIQSELGNAVDQISSTYEQEGNKNREHAAKIADEMGFSIDQMSTDISSSIALSSEQTQETIKKSTEQTVDAINLSSLHLGYKLNHVSEHLGDIKNNIQVSNQVLSYIAGKLEAIRHLMTIPNEVEALELADQARINFALGKNDKALEITEKAMELCSTSIPVTAYHIIALSSQTYTDSFTKIQAALKDYSNLISFKLTDKGSNEKLAILDSSTMTYPVINAVNSKFGASIYEAIKDVYSSLSVNKKAACHFIERGLIDTECAQMVNPPTILRELHWSTTGNVLTNSGVSYEKFSSVTFDNAVAMFLSRIEESKTPIEKELRLNISTSLHNTSRYKGYLVCSLPNENENENETNKDSTSICKNSTNIISKLLALEPQDSYTLTKVEKTLIAEYYDKNTNPPIAIEAIAQKKSEDIIKSIEFSYIPEINIARSRLLKNERDNIEKLNNKAKELKDDIVSRITSSNMFLTENENKINRIEQQISNYRKTSEKGYSNPEKAGRIAFWSMAIPWYFLLTIIDNSAAWYEIFFVLYLIIGVPGLGVIWLLSRIPKNFASNSNDAVDFADKHIAKLKDELSALNQAVVEEKYKIDKTIDISCQSLEDIRTQQNKKSIETRETMEMLLDTIRQKHYSNYLIKNSLLKKLADIANKDIPLEVTDAFNRSVDESINQTNELKKQHLSYLKI